MEMLTKELKHTGVIHIGKADTHDKLFNRVLHLVRDPDTHTLERKPMPDIRPKVLFPETVR